MHTLNIHFKDFWYTKINLTQIWYDENNKQHEFLILNNY